MHADTAIAAIRKVLVQHPEVRLGILFGSVAKGKARTDSDVDIAISAPVSSVLPLMGELSLSCEVDVVRVETAGIPLLDELLQDGLLAYEAKPGAFAAWRSRTMMMLETDRPAYNRMRDAFLKRLAQGMGTARGE